MRIRVSTTWVQILSILLTLTSRQAFTILSDIILRYETNEKKIMIIWDTTKFVVKGD